MFTDEELNIIAQIIRNIPITGTLDTLPVQLQKLATILHKIDAEFEARSYAASHSDESGMG